MLAADRRGLRYPSDLTDAEWAIVAAMIPPGRHGGRRRSVNAGEVLNGIFYVLLTGRDYILENIGSILQKNLTKAVLLGS